MIGAIDVDPRKGNIIISCKRLILGETIRRPVTTEPTGWWFNIQHARHTLGINDQLKIILGE